MQHGVGQEREHDQVVGALVPGAAHPVHAGQRQFADGAAGLIQGSPGGPRREGIPRTRLSRREVANDRRTGRVVGQRTSRRRWAPGRSSAPPSSRSRIRSLATPFRTFGRGPSSAAPLALTAAFGSAVSQVTGLFELAQQSRWGRTSGGRDEREGCHFSVRAVTRAGCLLAGWLSWWFARWRW